MDQHGTARMSRRTFLRSTALAASVAAGGGVPAAGCGRSDPEQVPVTVLQQVTTQLTWLRTVTYAGWYLADERGLFARHGVRSQLRSGGPDLVSTQSVVLGGGADVGMDDLFGLVTANREGADLVAFAAQFQRNPGGLVALEPIEGVESLTGKRVGVQSASVEERVRAAFELGGFEPDFTPVPVGGDVEPLIAGACDAMACFVTAQPVAMTLQGTDNFAVTFSDLGLVDYGNVLFCRRGYLEEQRDALGGFVRALAEGFAANNAAPEDGARVTVDLFGEDLGLDYDQQLAENQAQIPLMEGEGTQRHGLLWLDVERIAGPVARGLAAVGVTDLPAVDDFVDTSVLEVARDG